MLLGDELAAGSPQLQLHLPLQVVQILNALRLLQFLELPELLLELVQVLQQEEVVQDAAPQRPVQQDGVQEGLQEHLLLPDYAGLGLGQSSVAFEVGDLDAGEDAFEEGAEGLEVLESALDLPADGVGDHRIEDVVGHKYVGVHHLVGGDHHFEFSLQLRLIAEGAAF